jgi:hypothetical protein
VFISAGGGSGVKNIQNLENMEAKQKELEWLAAQARMMKDPLRKRNNIYTSVKLSSTFDDN